MVVGGWEASNVPLMLSVIHRQSWGWQTYKIVSTPLPGLLCVAGVLSFAEIFHEICGVSERWRKGQNGLLSMSDSHCKTCSSKCKFLQSDDFFTGLFQRFAHQSQVQM